MDSTSDLDKQMEGELDSPPKEELHKEADLYDRKLYTAIPINHDFTLGIFPKDQQLSDKYVLLWSTVRTIPTSIVDNNYKVIEIRVPSNEFIRQNLKTLPGGAYAVEYIPNTFQMKEVDPISFRE